MGLLFPFAPGQTDAEAPIDETLEKDNIQANLEDLATQIDSISGGGGSSLQFKVNGNLTRLKSLIDSDVKNGLEMDGAFVTALRKFVRARLFIKKNGNTGQTKADVRRHVKVNHPIKSLMFKGQFLTQSIGIIGNPLATQSVSKRTPGSATQSINRTEANETISSIVNIGNDVFKINTTGIDLVANWKPGAIVVISGANALNNGEFEIIERNYEGSPSVLVSIPGGIDETGIAATLNLNRFAYVFLAVADAIAYKIGENLIATGHTTGANNGTFVIDAVNEAANDLVIYNNTAGATVQAGIAGDVNTERFVYTFLLATLATDYIVGQTNNCTGHSNALNNGKFEIVELNETGNNLVVRNSVGVVQAGVAGTVNTNLWVYAVDSDPSLDVTVGDTLRFENHTSASNDLNAVVVELSRAAADNIIVFNESGVVQAGVAGDIFTELMVVEFFQDESASYIVDGPLGFISVADIIGMPDAINNGKFTVEAINIDFANNIVFKNISGIEYVDPVGQIHTEIRSLFSTLPTIPAGEDFSIGSNGVLIDANTEAESMIMLDILELPEGGLPEDVSLDLE